MANSLERTGQRLIIDTLRTTEFFISFSSKYYIEIDVVYNCNLNKIISDYAGTNATHNTSGNAIILDLNSYGTFIDTCELISISTHDTDVEYPYNPSIGNDNNKIVDGRMRMVYNYLTSESNAILPYNTSFNSIIHDGDPTEKIMNNGGFYIPPPLAFSFSPNIISPFVTDYSVRLGAMKFTEYDNFVFYPNQSNKRGVSSSTSGNIIDKETFLSSNPQYGDRWYSTSDYGFEHTTSGTSGLLNTYLTYNMPSTSIFTCIDKHLTTDDFIAVSNITSMVCLIDNDYDNISLTTSTPHTTQFSLYIPVLKDWLIGDNLIATITFSGMTNGGSASQLNGTTADSVVKNGEVTFDVTFPGVPNSGTGTHTGTVIITTTNGLNISKDVSISVTTST